MFFIEIILAILIFVAFSKIKGLQNQINAIRKGEMSKLSQTDQIQQATKHSTPSIESQVQWKEPEPNPLMGWIKDNWMLKIGILLILIGFGWFVSYAFVHNWVGPIGRITIGFLIGAIVSLFGAFRMKKSISQGGSFLILGSAIIMITVFAARFIYTFFNPFVALGIVFLSAAYTTLSALRYNSKGLAVSALIVASIAPMLTNSPTVDYVGLFLYIMVIVLGSLWVMFYKNWREVGAAASVMVLLYSIFSGLFGHLGSSEYLVLNLAYLMAIIFFISNIFSILRFGDKAGKEDGILAIANGALIMLWTMSHAPDVWQSLILAAWMVIFAVGSFIVFAKTKNDKFFYLYSLLAVVFLVTATAIELQGNALVFAFIFESAIISIAGYVITGKEVIGHRLSLLMLAPAFMTLSSFASHAWRTGFMHQDFAIILSMSVVLCGVGYFYYLLHKNSDPEYVSGYTVSPYTLMIIVGSYFFFGLIWKTSFAIFESSMSILVSLAIYTIIGITSYFFGKLNERKVYQYYGAVLLVLVLIRLIFVDVWNMELGLRISTFILIGILFVSTAFIGKKPKKEEVTESEKQNLTNNLN